MVGAEEAMRQSADAKRMIHLLIQIAVNTGQITPALPSRRGTAWDSSLNRSTQAGR